MIEDMAPVVSVVVCVRVRGVRVRVHARGGGGGGGLHRGIRNKNPVKNTMPDLSAKRKQRAVHGRGGEDTFKPHTRHSASS